MRVLISKESKSKLLSLLKLKYESSSLKEVSSKMKIPFKTLKQWIYEEKRYIPLKIISSDILNEIKILDSKEDNWGQSKGGKIGGKKSVEKLMQRLGKEKYSEVMSERGKKLINTIWKRYNKEELIKMAIQGKIRKRGEQSRRLEEQNLSFFENKKVPFDSRIVQFSDKDIKKRIKLPKEVTRELAEEIGIHLGDGCMSFNRHYFSVKTNKKEETYVTEFLVPLYKKLYNIEIKIMRLESVSGFEVYSKALCEFKNKILGIPYGKKIHKIKIPEMILDTKSKEVYCALIRGLFDTDGCICVVKKDYPVISISIKSEQLIKKLSEMLKLLGFIPHAAKFAIYLNGKVMLKKWIKEIDSSNPIKKEKLRWASSITG